MSINSINGVNNYNYGVSPSDPIKPETRKKLKELGIDEKTVKTETQAQDKIQQKEQEIQKQIQERLKAEASQNAQGSQAFAQQPQQVQGVQQPEQSKGVDGVSQSQQVKQPEKVQEQTGVQNQQTGNEQMKAFAASGAQQAQQVQPFSLGDDIIAMHNKLKLGLI